jgi:hypothetical protein
VTESALTIWGDRAPLSHAKEILAFWAFDCASSEHDEMSRCEILLAGDPSGSYVSVHSVARHTRSEQVQERPNWKGVTAG